MTIHPARLPPSEWPGRNQQGENNAHWKGGIRHNQGYVYLFRPSHPRANLKGYVHRSILNWEEANERPFPDGMEPHHKNEIKGDDRPENIEPKTHSKHTHDHKMAKEK